jgi:hypothetical protein
LKGFVFSAPVAAAPIPTATGMHRPPSPGRRMGPYPRCRSALAAGNRHLHRDLGTTGPSPERRSHDQTDSDE